MSLLLCQPNTNVMRPSINVFQNLNEEKAENDVVNRGMSPQLMTDLQDVLGNNQFGPKTSSPSGKEIEEKERGLFCF